MPPSSRVCSMPHWGGSPRQGRAGSSPPPGGGGGRGSPSPSWSCPLDSPHQQDGGRPQPGAEPCLRVPGAGRRQQRGCSINTRPARQRGRSPAGIGAFPAGSTHHRGGWLWMLPAPPPPSAAAASAETKEDWNEARAGEIGREHREELAVG